MATAVGAPARRSSFQAKHAMWVVYGILTLIVLLFRERTLLDPNSFLRQRYAPISWLMYLHGIPAAIALILGVFQFSTPLRQRYPQIHRVMGRIYVGCVFIGAPVAFLIETRIPLPTGMMIVAIHASGWLLTTGTALYCIRVGNIQQHREWMIRSYPFAMVFIVARAVGLIPAIERAGIMASVASIWTVLAVACFLPSFLIEWQAIAKTRRTTKVRAMAMAD